MKKFSMLLALMCFMVFPLIQLHSQTQGVGENDIIGFWVDDVTKDTLEIFKDGTTFSARIFKLKEPNDPAGNPRKDVLNKDPRLRDRLLEGLIIMTDCEFDQHEWEKGKFYDYNDGDNYFCEMSFPDVNDKKKLKVFTYNSSSDKTTYWTKKD